MLGHVLEICGEELYGRNLCKVRNFGGRGESKSEIFLTKFILFAELHLRTRFGDLRRKYASCTRRENFGVGARVFHSFLLIAGLYLIGTPSLARCGEHTAAELLFAR